MNQVKFTATRLANTGKRGINKPDEDGYYTSPIGGLNTYNSAGEYYTLEGAKELFSNSSTFMRRIANGCLKGESGHPKKVPNMSDNDFLTRILTIDESNICVHFKEIWLDESFGKNNPQYKNDKLVAIMAKYKPSGVNGASLQKSLDNPDENVCFSIRALTNNFYQRGETFRVLTSIVTFDNVNEPGIAISTKWNSPSLESMLDEIVTKSQLERVCNIKTSNVVLESTKDIAAECLKSSFVELPRIPTSLFTKW